MGLFICSKCDCVENTALGCFHSVQCKQQIFDMTGLEEYNGKPLCSECAPQHYVDGTKTRWNGKWHNKFPKEQVTAEQKRRCGKGGLIL